MAKQVIKRFLPDPKKIQNNKFLKIFGKLLYSPNLWHLNRQSVATAFSIGLFITYIPFPGHMLLAALMSIIFRANLPISVALVWVVNPFTIIPMFGFATTLGAFLLGIALQDLSFNSFAVFQEVWQPFLLGCFICGSLLALAGNVCVRMFWRYTVAKNWRARQLRRSINI
ncbi:MAG: DUF2062 domain-containing protein [Gammaproteobacteria bacterium]|jgi:uncharacterized protein (DUF2062 family)|nr:DUF2062 domain-containing protein [Gammaproteobacteria bacterium]